MRKVICCDAFEKLGAIKPVSAIVTSLPDASEVECGLTGYIEWFNHGVRKVLSSVSPNGVAIFYQGDRKHKGTLLSKATLLCNTAHSLNLQLLWHKIVLRNRLGTINLYRPSFLHMMAFSCSLKAGRPTIDVIDQGKTIYKNGMNINAAIIAIRFAVEKTKTDIIYDPFCGRGTVLAVANALGVKSVGFDISEEQCTYARDLQVSLPGTK